MRLYTFQFVNHQNFLTLNRFITENDAPLHTLVRVKQNFHLCDDEQTIFNSLSASHYHSANVGIPDNHINDD